MFKNQQNEKLTCTFLHHRPIKNLIKGLKQNYVQYRSPLTFKNKNPTLQTFIEEFKTVVSAKIELVYRNRSLLIPLLKLSAYQDSNSDSKINFLDFHSGIVSHN